MTDQLPERIWAPTVDILALEVFNSLRKQKTNSGPCYLRADTAIPRAEADAMVAAAVDLAIEGIINEAVGMADGADEASYIEKRLRHSAAVLTPADARAAFEQAVREARQDVRDNEFPEVERLAVQEAVEAERERCAMIAERLAAEIMAEYENFGSDGIEAAFHIAAVIRAQQETSE